MSGSAAASTPLERVLLRPLESLLLRPLWGVVSDYFEPGERWYYAGVPAFGIKAGSQAPDLPAALVECGHLPALAAWLGGVPHPRRKKAFSCVVVRLMVRLDRAEMLEFVRRRYPKSLKRYYAVDNVRRGDQVAADFGSIETLKWERKHGFVAWNCYTATLLARGGHLAALQQVRLAVPPCPWDGSAMLEALARDQIDVVGWLKTTDLDYTSVDVNCHIYTRRMLDCFTKEADLKQVLFNALNKGSLEFVRYLLEQTDVEKYLNAVAKDLAILYACTGCRQDVTKLVYLLERGYPRPKQRVASMIMPYQCGWIEANCGFE